MESPTILCRMWQSGLHVVFPNSECNNVLIRCLLFLFHNGHLFLQFCSEITKKAVYLHLENHTWKSNLAGLLSSKFFGGGTWAWCKAIPLYPSSSTSICTWKVILRRNRASLVSSATRGVIPRDCAVFHRNTETTLQWVSAAKCIRTFFLKGDHFFSQQGVLEYFPCITSSFFFSFFFKNTRVLIEQ